MAKSHEERAAYVAMSPLARVIHDTIEQLPHERRLYPDLYSQLVAEAIQQSGLVPDAGAADQPDVDHRAALRLTGISPLSFDDIREYAARVGAGNDIYDSVGRSDMDAFVAQLGGTLTPFRDAMMMGAMSIFGHGQFSIVLPGVESDRRRRFRIARALGWYFLLYREPELTGFRFVDESVALDAVTQANVFAAALLMPTEQFLRAFAELDGHHWALADRFGVSPAAAGTRAASLGLTAPPAP
jgi:hypothetical protein